jgi:hypothetical protein
MAGKSKKLKIKKLQINLTNRWLYTLIVFFSLVVIGVFVYAVAPNPGHDITQIAQPSGCDADQFLKWTGSSWTCDAVIAQPSGCGANQFLKWTGSAWTCANVTVGGAETDPIWTGESTNVAFINKANAFGAFAQSFDTNVLFVDATNDRVGIGTTTPEYELDVSGDANADFFIGDGSMLTNLIVRVQGIDETCDGTMDGLLRYRSSYCVDQNTRTSSFAICMRQSDSFYYWNTLRSYSWTDDDCDCPSGTRYYECTGDYVRPGCYSSRPPNCYRHIRPEW